MEEPGWLKRMMEEAVEEIDKRPVWLKPADLRQQEIGKNQQYSEAEQRERPKR